MADVVPTTRKQSLQTAGVIVGGVITFNTLFWVASYFYYDDKPLQIADAGAVRVAFGILSFIVAVMAYGAALAPRLIGHGIAFVMGAALLAGGIAAIIKDLPPVMGITMLVFGGIVPALALRSLNHSRTAWSFLISTIAVFATVTFFGAPKVRHLLHIGLWNAMILPGVMIVSVMALTMIRGEYRDRV